MADNSYTFSSDPRAAPPARKYRPPGDNAGPVNTTGAAANIMYDARVRRGNTYAGKLVATAAADAAAATRGGSTMGGTGRSGMGRTRPAKPSIFDMKPPARERVEVDVTPFLIEAKEAVPEVEVTTQTDVFERRPDTPDYVPKKTGIDAYTQIDGLDNLFNFDREVAPILEVIVGKTLEQALLECEEESELADIELRKQQLHADKRSEAEALKRMEAKEQERFVAMERRRAEELERVRAERTAYEKVAALSAGRNLAAVAAGAAMAALSRQGAFRDPRKDEVEAKFMPFLLQSVEAEVDRARTGRALADEAIRRALAAGEQALAARRAEDERRRKEEEERGFLRVFVKGVTDEDGKDMLVGPIPVTRNDTIEAVEGKIRAWLKAKMGERYVEPAEGFLRLGYAGAALAPGTTLLSAHVPDEASLDVIRPQAEGEDE